MRSGERGSVGGPILPEAAYASPIAVGIPIERQAVSAFLLCSPPSLVLARCFVAQEAIRSCRDKTLCSSSDTTELLRDEVIRLMQQDSSAASAFSCHAHIWEESDVSMSIQSDAKSEVSPPPVVLGIPSASREQEDVCMEESQTEESDGDDLDFSERHEAVEEHDVVEARQVQEDERAVEGRRDAKMRDGQCRREEHGNRGVEVAEASGASEALALAGFDGGKRPERHETHTTSNFSRARALGQMEGRNGNERRNERQASSIVVLSGWEANDMQAMLRVRKRVNGCPLSLAICCCTLSVEQLRYPVSCAMVGRD